MGWCAVGKGRRRATRAESVRLPGGSPPTTNLKVWHIVYMEIITHAVNQPTHPEDGPLPADRPRRPAENPPLRPRQRGTLPSDHPRRSDGTSPLRPRQRVTPSADHPRRPTENPPLHPRQRGTLSSDRPRRSDGTSPLRPRQRETLPVGRPRQLARNHCQSSIEVWQINLHRSRTAVLNLSKEIEKLEALIVLMQEPWTVGSRICGRPPGGEFHSGTTPGSRPRACIYTRGVEVWRLDHFCSRDMATIRIETKREPQGYLIVSSVYMAAESTAPPAELRGLVQYCQEARLPLLVGTDCNSHHPAWGSTDMNPRGQSLMEFIAEYGLDWLNRGNVPTFVTANRKEVLDITLVNSWARSLGEDWRVDQRPSFSDHRYIRFTLAEASMKERKYRPVRKTNWTTFRRKVEEAVKSTDFIHLLPKEEVIEAEARNLERIMITAFEAACPKRTVVAKTEVTWWNQRLEQLKSNKLKLLAKAQRSKTDEAWGKFRQARLTLKKEIRKANRDSFRKRMEAVENSHELSRAVKFLQRDPSIQLNTVQKGDGQPTESPKETLEEMLAHHIPGAEEPEVEDPPRGPYLPTEGIPLSLAEEIMEPGLMERAAKRFDPYKGPGPDGIYPIMIQKALETPLRERYRNLFIASLRTGYIPRGWREGRGVFIPKPGKDSYMDKKSYRMITLSSFQLKWMERLVLWYLERNKQVQSKTNKRQFGFKPGVSCETALHQLVKRVEKALENQEYAVGVFLDIQNAFPTVAMDSISRALQALGVNAGIQHWIEATLAGRLVTAELKGTAVTKRVTRGCPQGSILSPFLWNAVMDDFLNKTRHMGVYAQAYADDVVGLFVGKDPPTLVDLANLFMARAVKWGRENDLTFSQAKTEVVIFTRKRLWNPKSPFRMNGQVLNVSKTAKYLGITLDNKLTFNAHVEGKVKVATRLLHQAGRLVGKTWGLTPRRAKWVYTAMVRPLIAYGAVCWTKVTESAAWEAKLRKLQRVALLQMTAAYPSTPTAALEMLTGLLPLHLHLREVAVAASVRLARSGHWQTAKTAPHKGWLKTHTDICNRIRRRIPELHMPEDEVIVQWTEPPNFKVSICSRHEAANREYDLDTMVCYTDGSKSQCGATGAGVFIEGAHEISANEPLGKTASVFQAEVRAIEMASNLLLDNKVDNKNIVIRVDNQAALKAVSSQRCTKKTVMGCQSALQKLGRRNRVLLEWVPGHSDIPGNDRADLEAKKGAQRSPIGPAPHVPIPEPLIKDSIQSFFQEEHRKAWWAENRFRQTKEAVGWSGKGLPNILLSLNRKAIRLILQVITGHASLRRHKALADEVDTDPMCPLCGRKEETPQHFVGECRHWSDIRKQVFGKDEVKLADELLKRNIRSIARFIALTRRLESGGTGPWGVW